jgi:ABC-type xylose transport system permease subunit
MMVKDKFTKYIVSITTSTVCTVEAIAGLFDLNMLKYIEVPSNIVTDRGCTTYKQIMDNIV